MPGAYRDDLYGSWHLPCLIQAKQLPAASDGYMIQLAGAVLLRPGMVLLGRGAAHKAFADFSDIFGRRVEDGETVAAALKRELLEKLLISPIGPVLLKSFDIGVPSNRARLHDFQVRNWSGDEPTLSGDEHVEIRWFGLSEAAYLNDFSSAELAELFKRLCI